MTRILIAPDSFKESLSADKVCKAIAEGIQGIFPSIYIKEIPIADGGEGTIDALISAIGGQKVFINTEDPLGRPVNSFFGVFPDQTAIIEIASASGLHLVENTKRNPLKTSSFGTGLIFRHLILNGYQKILLTLGGSATNDGGTGIFQALGGKIFDRDGVLLDKSPEKLLGISSIEKSGLVNRMDMLQLTIACDVENYLLGNEGASYIYGPQKGASPSSLPILDSFLSSWVSILEKDCNRSLKDIKGSGAAGGIALPFLAFSNCTLKRGFDLISELTNLEEEVQSADIVISGEGSIDQQTFYGKTVKGVYELCKKYNKQLVLIAGQIQPGVLEEYSPEAEGFSILSIEADQQKAIENGAELLVQLVHKHAHTFLADK